MTTYGEAAGPGKTDRPSDAAPVDILSRPSDDCRATGGCRPERRCPAHRGNPERLGDLLAPMRQRGWWS